jgi:proline iminopeptidase
MIAVNGANLWVAEQGAGPALVLCSGGPGVCDYLGPVADMIDDLARVYRFEPRGCGRSSAEGPFDLPTALADLDALRDALGYERWIVAGHSWGASLALAYALEYPDRADALLYLAGGGIVNDRQWHAAYVEGRDAGREVLPEPLYPHNMEVNRACMASTREYHRRPGLLRDLAQLTVPMLAISGGEDIRPSWPVEQLANLMPNARFVLLEGDNHEPWHTDGSALRAVMREYLKELRSDAEPGA